MIARPTWRNSGVWLFVCFSFLPGCATIFHQNDAGAVRIESDPEGADISIDGGDLSCVTPCKVGLLPSANHILRGEIYGYETEVRRVERSAHWTFWLNALLGITGLLGAGIDFATGSIWTLDRDRVFFDFQPIEDDEDYEDDGESADDEEYDETDDDDDDDAEAKEAAGTARAPRHSVTGDESEDSGEETSGDERPKAPRASPDASPHGPALPEPAPATSLELQEMREKFPETYVGEQVDAYYGGQPRAERRRTIERLYRILIEMERGGERPNIDEAVRRDVTRRLR